MKRIFKCTLTGFLTLLFVFSVFAKPILAASDFYESTWQGKHYIARANVTPHASQATLEYQDQTAMLKVNITVQCQRAWETYTITRNDTGRGSVEANYSPTGGFTIVNQNGRYYIGPSQVYQNSLNS